MNGYSDHVLLGHLVLHCAVISRNMDLVKFLVSNHPEFLEFESVDGWTPLLFAAMERSIEAIQILLEAGAHPFATDLLGRNMLHLLLVSPGPDARHNLNELSSFLHSLNRLTLQKLLEQRCAENPGGLTPFARWILHRAAFDHEPDVLCTTVLELSRVAMLEILDGAGRTPLHIVH